MVSGPFSDSVPFCQVPPVLLVVRVPKTSLLHGTALYFYHVCDRVVPVLQERPVEDIRVQEPAQAGEVAGQSAVFPDPIRAVRLLQFRHHDQRITLLACDFLTVPLPELLQGEFAAFLALQLHPEKRCQQQHHQLHIQLQQQLPADGPVLRNHLLFACRVALFAYQLPEAHRSLPLQLENNLKYHRLLLLHMFL